MAFQIETAYVNTYKDQVELLSQQTQSILEQHVTTGDYQGEAASPILQVGVIKPMTQTSRVQDKSYSEAPLTRRWIKPAPLIYSTIPIEREDEVKMLAQLQGGYAQAQVAAFGVEKDKQIITAAFGTALTGKDGSTSTAFDTSGDVAVGFGAAADTGLNYAKFVEADRIFDGRKVKLMNGDYKVAAIKSYQHSQMKSQIEFIKSEYHIVPTMDKNGNIVEFAGWRIAVTEELPTTSNVTSCLFYVKSGLHLGHWSRMRGYVRQNQNKVGDPWEVYADEKTGAARTDELKVLRVKCLDSL